ncbi:DNA repair ATPase [Chitinophagales bacterium]|nr:DNA repair ATPase [Chitinophagales bacterium]
MSEQSDNIQLEQGNYEIVRGRLNQQGANLRDRLSKLDSSRKEVFGSLDYSLFATDRIHTQNHCQAADIVALNEHCIFGYNVHIGLRSEVQLKDVFSIYRFKEEVFEAESLDLLADPQFEVDFQNLYKYYRNTVFRRFVLQDNALFLLFQVSDKLGDLKAFKWLVKNGELQYIDDRSYHEVRYADQLEFNWTKASHEMYQKGRHAHVSILDRVFVETTEGDLTIKVENNTDTGQGIYAEPVDEKDQSLDDAEFHFADLGNLIALKIRPYKEDPRYFVFNEKAQQVQRIDSLADSAVILPDNHGILFPDGYYLQTGDFKRVEHGLKQLQFERRIPSPNGEDILYVFHDDAGGNFLLLSYNVIKQEIATPISCNGYALFDNGKLCYFKAETDPTKHHVIQIWNTPFMKSEFLPTGNTENYLFKVGNKDIVKGMAECQELLVLIGKDDSYGNLYEDLVKRSTDLIDSYYWLDRADAEKLAEPIGEIRRTAESAIDEFEKVRKLRKDASKLFTDLDQKAKEYYRKTKNGFFEEVSDFVQSIAELRNLRGELITAKEIRYIDIAALAELEEKNKEITADLSERCVQFLLKKEALIPYEQRIKKGIEQIPSCATAKEASGLSKEFNQLASELEMLIEVVSNLKIDDATESTRIVENISAIFSQLNRSKSELKKHLKSLSGTEAVAEFSAQLKLVDQAVVSYMDLCEQPKQCDEYLTRLMVQLEELEARFSDFDEFTAPLSEKREEIYSIFESRKLQLLEKRNRRASSLYQAAERILKGMNNRSSQLKDMASINAYFASDLMMEKARDIVEQLRDLNDIVKAEDIESKLKALRENSIRQFKDRSELFLEGEDIIKLGKHNFYVNTQPLDLTIVYRKNELYYHITGTAFFEKIIDQELNDVREVWQLQLPSESPLVYRAEFLAFQFFLQWKNNYQLQKDLAILETPKLKERLEKEIKELMGSRFSEGYTKGVHDADAVAMLLPTIQLAKELDLLIYAPDDRALARFFWQFDCKEDQKTLLKQIKGTGLLSKNFPMVKSGLELERQVMSLIEQSKENSSSFKNAHSELAAEYLVKELAGDDKFQLSKESAELLKAFETHLSKNKGQKEFEKSCKELSAIPGLQLNLLRGWLTAFCDSQDKTESKFFLLEAAVELQSKENDNSQFSKKSSQLSVDKLAGEHQQIEGGEWKNNLSQYLSRLSQFNQNTAPKFEAFLHRKKELSQQRRYDLRLQEFEPKILSSFVRNQLIDQLYLPLFGDNFAKQIGTAGTDKRADRMGLLLLISPPGYGKTTLMEYISNRLGLVFVKINGPAIGHSVVAIDPEAATNAAAKEELERLNLAFEMGDNIMLYLDDIQHCNPEFLQKFISLCDGQRKIEGVFNGRSKTYDLKGKRVCVVMAGNPYTESGEKFQIPDMLANRADIYNLGDIIGGSDEAFKLSYLENSASSNKVIARLTAKSRKDFLNMIKVAETGSREGFEFESEHSSADWDEYLSVIKKLLTIRDVILSVNKAYIHSAAQNDDYRTEPPFRLQGSYRDMNKLTEKVVAIMNDSELNQLILSHYESESQTLTSGAESNFLKFKELIGIQTTEEKERWETIKSSFKGKNETAHTPEERMGQVITEMRAYSQDLLKIIDKKLGS